MKKFYAHVNGNLVFVSDSLAEINNIVADISVDNKSTANKISELYAYPDTIDIEKNDDLLADFFQSNIGTFDVCNKRKKHIIAS